MRKKISAGFIVFRRSEQNSSDSDIEVLITHFGGPYFADKDEGSWVIPRGEVEEGEDIYQTAIRELQEETGIVLADDVKPLSLGFAEEKHKITHAWAVESNLPHDTEFICESMVTLEWPPKSGKTVTFPESDKTEFVDIDTARNKLRPALLILVDRLIEHLNL
ncbi:NUDIX domain-containing protein [candidate division WWE3 bacterium]|uniref:NUDIX domain-containing protein n=1 Tax=candidate division WWE3 bacterium TaxID=2053526 RepID=A0A955LKV3_UNCKA|nr:NUDIX domain-containing protein [candidate division WWE3 bacterium]